MIDPDPWHPLYDLWTSRSDPPPPEELARGLPEWVADHRLEDPHGTAPWWTLRLVDPEGHPVAQVEHGPAQGEVPTLTRDEDPDAALEHALQQAQSRYVISIRRDADTPVRAVQTALSLAWAILGRQNGVLHDLSALRLLRFDELQSVLARDNFAIEDHVSLHLVTDETTQQGWLHSHGMEKFGRSDLETFDLDVALGRDAGKLMNTLLLSAALDTRPLLGERIEVPGGTLRAMPSAWLRPGVLSIPDEELDDHDGPFLCLVDGETHGNISRLVDGYLHRSLAGLEDPQAEREITRHLLPLVRLHFGVNGSSEEFEYFARIPLLIQRGERTTHESVWVKITRWRDTGLRGTLASDSVLDQGMQMGVEVEFEPEDIEAILLSDHGEPVAGKHLEKLLRS